MTEPAEPDASDAISEEDVRDAFRHLSASKTFTGSDRLIGFLRYVVNEKLDGRGDLIRGKSIAMDVYGYGPEEVEKREGVVRVDGGRVRRKLDEYYASEGMSAKVRIELPKGAYLPNFVLSQKRCDAPQVPTPRQHARRRWSLPIVGSVGGLVLIGALFMGSQWQNTVSTTATSTSSDNTSSSKRAILFETSPDRLQAANLAEQGRVLMFPATDPQRLTAAMNVFEASMNIDDTYAGGYAGASQVFGLRSLISPNPELSEELQDKSESFALEALKRSPEMPWAISARAWAYFAEGDYERAVNWSQRAKELAPDDPYVFEFDALILLYDGQFQKLLEETEHLAERQGEPLPFVFQNARSAAFFHLGEYQQAVDGFESAISMGAPVGPVSVSYLMAGYQYLGDQKRSHELSEKYLATWPQHRVDLLKHKLFRNSSHSIRLVDGMLAAGWAPI